MKLGALINFILIGSVATGLTGVMLKGSDEPSSSEGYAYEVLEKLNELPPDTPVVKEPVDLKYDFKDNTGKPPQYDPKMVCIYVIPKTLRQQQSTILKMVLTMYLKK